MISKRLVALAGIIAVALATSGYATYPNEAKLTGGPYGRYYWLDGSVDSTLANLTFNAKKSWGLATSKIALAETASEGASTFQVFQSNKLYPQSFCAITVMIDANGQQLPDPISADWAEARFLISPEAKQGFGACPNAQGIVAHEFGHGFGLAHMEAPNVALMRSDIRILPYTVPKVDDVTGINHLY